MTTFAEFRVQVGAPTLLGNDGFGEARIVPILGGTAHGETLTGTILPGGTDEQRAAEFIKLHMRKPVTAFIAGQTAPPGKRMGHAGAIIEGGEGTAAEKMAAFEQVGVRVARHPGEIAQMAAELA